MNVNESRGARFLILPTAHPKYMLRLGMTQRTAIWGQHQNVQQGFLTVRLTRRRLVAVARQHISLRNDGNSTANTLNLGPDRAVFTCLRHDYGLPCSNTN